MNCGISEVMLGGNSTRSETDQNAETDRNMEADMERYLVRKSPVSGGDINRAYALGYSDGSAAFMKVNRKENIGFFRAEAEGLAAIEKTGAIRVPKVICMGQGIGTGGAGGEADDAYSSAAGPGSSYLVLEYIERGRPAPGSYERFGRNLAAMHSADTSSFTKRRFGFLHDNYIGSGVQINEPKDTWIEFFAECRLRPQFERASVYFDTDEMMRIDELLCHLDRYLIEPGSPSLLHGDLWGGNHMADETGEIMLIDPAVYVGHAEADIAMTELFGGYRREFYAAYDEARPMEPGYEDRRDLYNLYHLLNHLNLFGAGYLGSVRSILKKYY